MSAMSNDERKKALMSQCSINAEDCRGNADFAAYAFKSGDMAAAKQYVDYLESNLRRLKSVMGSIEELERKADHVE